MSDSCPECEAPLGRDGTHCAECGWDADPAGSDDAYLDGIDLPVEMDDDGYVGVLEDEGLASRPRGAWRSVVVVTAALMAVVLTMQATCW